MSSYHPPQWAGLQLPAQTGGLRLTGPIPLNIANDIKIAAPEKILLASSPKTNFIYPIALILRRMDHEVLRLQAAYQKEKASSPQAKDPSHFVLRLTTPNGEVHEAIVEDLAKVQKKEAVDESPFALDFEYAYQGVTVTDREIERSRAGAQATTREYIFDLGLYFPSVTFLAGVYSVHVSTLALSSNEATTLLQIGSS